MTSTLNEYPEIEHPDFIVAGGASGQNTTDLSWLMQQFARDDLPTIDIDATLAALVDLFICKLPARDAVTWLLENCFDFRGYEDTEHHEYVTQVLTAYAKTLHRDLHQLGLFKDGYPVYDFARLLPDDTLLLRRANDHPGFDAF